MQNLFKRYMCMHANPERFIVGQWITIQCLKIPPSAMQTQLGLVFLKNNIKVKAMQGCCMKVDKYPLWLNNKTAVQTLTGTLQFFHLVMQIMITKCPLMMFLVTF